MIEQTIPSARLPAPRKTWIHHAASGAATDCLIFLDGELFKDRVKSADLLNDAQNSAALAPVTCLYLPNASAAARHADYTCNEAFADFLAQEMPAWIEREVGRFERLFLCGLSLSALQAVFTALRHPGVFAGVLAQSPSAWWREEWLASTLQTAPLAEESGFVAPHPGVAPLQRESVALQRGVAPSQRESVALQRGVAPLQRESVAAQNPAAGPPGGPEKRPLAAVQRLWLSVGTQELQTHVSHPPTPLLQTTSQLDSVRRLNTALTAAGHVTHLNEYDGGHDPVCWGGELCEALRWLTKLPS